MRPQLVNLSQTGIVVCLLVIVGYAAVDLVPCDKSRRVFTNSWGVITDGPLGSNYTQDSHCEWLIRANNTNRYITLSFRSMGTECSYDYVFVYDGDSFRSPLLGSFSGKTEPQRVTASSGYMLILLYSDTNYVLDGFRAEFSITDCPNNCSGNGVCFQDVRNKCVCNNDWGGFDCSQRLCPDECGVAQQQGRCQSGQCVCYKGFSGRSCSLPDRDVVGNKWHWLSHSEGGLSARAAHTAVYVKSTDSLYVFGGYDLNNVLGHLEVYSFANSTWSDFLGRELLDRSVFHAIEPASVPKLFQQAGRDWQEKWGLTQGHSFLKNLLYAAGENVTAASSQRRKKRDVSFSEPMARYGHAACNVTEGFVMFGGKLENGSLANDLWLFSVLTRSWELRAQSSTIAPPALTRHSLTASVDDVLYLFGGSTADGEFSSRLFRIRISPDDASEQWQELKARGGKELDVRVVAHSTVYHHQTNSLLIYGGIVAGVARFSKLSDRMFAFQLDNRHWTEIHYTREHLRDRYVPRERAFHSANVLGNYLIIFGGYSHRHNKEEICYDNQMYLYHLGCHTWANPEILGKSADSRYPKQQGVFAHSASIRNGNTLLLVGGYHGNVNGDLLAYTVPPSIASADHSEYDPEKACVRHKSNAECLADPECGYCSVDGVCYGRTVGANCTTNLQTTRCPGICPALGDCHSCLIHGRNNHNFNSNSSSGSSSSSSSSNAKALLKSAAQKLGLMECTWCVQNAKCHHKDDNYGVCGLREDSPSQMPGWWGAKGTEVLEPRQCRELDRRPGLTFVKYHHPVNFSQPDHVTIINATTVDYSNPTNLVLKAEQYNGRMVARLMGFLRPPSQWQEMLKVCVSFCNATLKLNGKLLSNITAEQRECQPQRWMDGGESSGRVSVDFESHKFVTIGGFNTHLSKMELQHHREKETPKVFTFEYLEPYANGTCEQYKNCLHCLTDSQCGWCELSRTCASRLEDESATCRGPDAADWRYLTLQPSACSNCSNFISCESCVGTGLCEWRVEEAKCSRIGYSPDAAVSLEQCPTPCYERSNCSACLEQRGRCVWCEATQQCFSFSVYTSEYQFGLCREWLDQAFPLVTSQETALVPAPRPQEQCKSCAHHANCSSCLSSLSCGWCYNASNPISGMCVQGDFNNPHVSCSASLGIESAKWAYAQCPDVDECGLGIDDCHSDAICINTDGSFSCHCRKGYKGDGRHYCDRTCYNDCVHGVCSDKPNYVCTCDLGWTGDDCSVNCGCNNHSSCSGGVGLCDECQNWTMGKHCEFCQPGSYGNATTSQGCHQCQCNGHGNRDLGECHNVTGVCFCQDNTEGDQCDRCKANYYGNPLNGKMCYYQCEARGLLLDAHGQGISSRQAYSAPWSGTPTRECLWIINPIVEDGAAVIQLEINRTDLNVSCGSNAVYVYDGLPDIGSQSTLSAVFCAEEASATTIIESKSGQLTVHYKQGFEGEGFNAMYRVLSCTNCSFPRKCRNKMCVCEDGFVGPYCTEAVCPGNCSQRGSCDASYGRCLCSPGWGGTACDISLKNDSQLQFVELFNTQHLADNLEHLKKTLPRFGHSLSADRRGSLWMFGGYSLSHGPLNDIRLFDTRNSTWMQVTVDSTPDAKMPQGRYFHGADIIHSKQAIYVFGGLTKSSATATNRTLDDFWQFDIQNQRWKEIERDVNNWPASVAGHTLTSYRNASIESLVLIGGLSPPNGFLNAVWEYRLDLEQWESWQTRGKGPVDVIGHSTVFHAPSNSFYVYGGIDAREFRMKNRLYALNYDTKTWVDLNLFMPIDSDTRLPAPRFFHSAVTTDSYMVVFGGRTWKNSSEILHAYSYNCNQWINLLNATDWVGPLPRKTYAQAMTIDADGNAAYVIGGWGSDTKCTVYKIQIPKNLCSLWPNRLCLTVPDCAYCAIKLEDEVKEETCHSISQECPLQDVVNHTKNTNQARACSGQLLANCRDLQDCSSCMQMSECKWCSEMCVSNKTCAGTSVVTNLQECPQTPCRATDCVQCHQLEGCEWNQTEGACAMGGKGEKHSFPTCSAPCSHFNSCSTCLNTKECRWSTQLNECFAFYYVPAYCAGGVCGLVLDGDEKQFCPEPCESFNQCSTCLKHFHCGWCSAPESNGLGICADGSNERPLVGSCERVFEEDKNKNKNKNTVINLDLDMSSENNNTYSWYYVKCPPENECDNNHHTCAPDSELCVDLEEGFECKCGRGYKAGANTCEPVCSQGCVRGQCVQPDKCQCDFGYVGANCSIQCQCNGHANCEGPDKLDQCKTCHNNTMGDQCEKCKPLFVGDPANGGQCVPCLEYCNGHTDLCVGSNITEADLPEDGEELAEFLKEGPKDSARCIRCRNQTSGVRCDECIIGNFRGSEDHKDPCRACDCHGHGDTCDPVTGEKCNCKNNTESDICPSGSSKNAAQPCWRVQCSKCKEGYLGTPKEGHQCYKQLNMDAKMCFDAKPIDECKMKPKPLHPGEMVFFAIQPRFMNVDIRIMIDVTQGRLNVYMSRHDDSYVVFLNGSSGSHEIVLDPNGFFENGTYKTNDVLLERDAIGLRTYITVTQPKTMLAIKNLKDRLVITLPEEYHSLDTNRFYLVLQALDSEDSDKKVAYGIIFFRQDQLHIDLFVFFSVFFSCFFLFLAACVVAWKAKQAADVRRARRRHVVEMLHMAKRPFASVTLNLSARPKPRIRSAHYDLRPVAVEPTDDGLAAVATIFISLPGGHSPTVKLALASSLILLARQYPSGSRAFLRRRSMPPPPPT